MPDTNEGQPAWSFDGTKITFTGPGDVNEDGGGGLSDQELESEAGGWDVRTWVEHSCGFCGTAQDWNYCGGH